MRYPLKLLFVRPEPQRGVFDKENLLAVAHRVQHVHERDFADDASKQVRSHVDDRAHQHAARAAAEAEGKEGWKFSLQMPSYLPVMQYAQDASLRETMYRAYVTRAAEGSPRKSAPTLSISSSMNTGLRLPARRIVWMMRPGSAPT